MPQTLTTILALLMASFANAQGLTLPTEIAGEAGGFVGIKATTEGKSVRWVSLTPGLHVLPFALADQKATVVTATRPGRYRLLAYSAVGGEPTDPVVTTVIFSDASPAPSPVPPGPPGPEPVDALTKKIRDALASDPGTPAEKAAHANTLAGFFAAMAKHVQADQAATVGDLLSDYKAAIPSLLPAGAILGTRKLCGQEVAGVVGDDAEKKIDGPLKANLVALFAKLSKTLEAK